MRKAPYNVHLEQQIVSVADEREGRTSHGPDAPRIPPPSSLELVARGTETLFATTLTVLFGLCQGLTAYSRQSLLCCFVPSCVVLGTAAAL